MKNILIKGGPGTGKTLISRAIAYYVGQCGERVEDVFSKDILSDYTNIERYIESDYVEYFQVHSSMTYEDIVYGIEVSFSGTPTMAYAEKRIKKICDRALSDTNKYFIILDDIERTNASSLLGNMLYAMEYRNEPVLLCDGNTLVIPENVIIIVTECRNLYGTPIEYALRRRFDYEKELIPDEKVLDAYYDGHLSPGLKSTVLDVFETVRNFIANHFSEDVTQQSKYVPGHGMFIVSRATTEVDIIQKIHRKFSYQIFPFIKELAREGVILPTDSEMEILKQSVLTQLTAGIPATGSRSSVEKILINSGSIVGTFSLDDSKDYYENTIIPGNCKEHRAIIETICDAILTNQVLTIEKAMSDILLNTNIVKFEHQTKPGDHAAFLVKTAENMNYSYQTKTAKNRRSFYSSNACRTGRWKSDNDAPAYEVTYPSGARFEYIPLNAFRNVGFKTTDPVIHSSNNTASIYPALYRLVVIDL